MEKPTKKRSSILKKTSNDDASPTVTFTRSLRRISFSGRKSVKEFLAGDDKATIWGTSYEESANAEHSTSTLGLDDKSASNTDASKTLQTKISNVKSKTGAQNSSMMNVHNMRPTAGNQELGATVNSKALPGQNSLSTSVEGNLTANNISGNMTINGTMNITLDPRELEHLKLMKQYKQGASSRKRSLEDISCSWNDLKNISPTDTSIEKLLSFGVTEDEKYLLPKRKYKDMEMSNVANVIENNPKTQLKTLKMSLLPATERADCETIKSTSNFHTFDSNKSELPDKKQKTLEIMEPIEIDISTQEFKLCSGTNMHEEAKAKNSNNRKTVLFLNGADMDETAKLNQTAFINITDDMHEVTCSKTESKFLEGGAEIEGKGSTLSSAEAMRKNIHIQGDSQWGNNTANVKVDTRQNVLFNSGSILEKNATSGCQSISETRLYHSNLGERSENGPIEIDLAKTRINEKNPVQYNSNKKDLNSLESEDFKSNTKEVDKERNKTKVNETRTFIFDSTSFVAENAASNSKNGKQELKTRSCSSKRDDFAVSMMCSPILKDNNENGIANTKVNENNEDMLYVRHDCDQNANKREMKAPERKTILFSSTVLLDESLTNTCNATRGGFFERNLRVPRNNAMNFSSECSPVLGTNHKNDDIKTTDNSEIMYLQNNKDQLGFPVETMKKHDGTLYENANVVTDTRENRVLKKDRKTILFQSGAALDESVINAVSVRQDQMNLTKAYTRGTMSKKVKPNKIDSKNTVLFNSNADLDETPVNFFKSSKEESAWFQTNDLSIVESQINAKASNVINEQNDDFPSAVNYSTNKTSEEAKTDSDCNVGQFIFESQGNSRQHLETTNPNMCSKSEGGRSSSSMNKENIYKNNEKIACDQLDRMHFSRNEADLTTKELDVNSIGSRKTVLMEYSACLGTTKTSNQEIDASKENINNNLSKQRSLLHFSRSITNPELKDNRVLKQSTEVFRSTNMKVEGVQETNHFPLNQKNNEKVVTDQPDRNRFCKNEAGVNIQETDERSTGNRKTIIFDHMTGLEEVKPCSSQKDKDIAVDSKRIDSKRRGTILFEDDGNLNETGLEIFDKVKETDMPNRNPKNNLPKQCSLLHFTCEFADHQMDDNQSLKKSKEVLSKENTEMKLETPPRTNQISNNTSWGESFLEGKITHKDHENFVSVQTSRNPIFKTLAGSKTMDCDGKSTGNRKTIIFDRGAPIDSENARLTPKDNERVIKDPKRRGTILFVNAGNLDETGFKLSETQDKNKMGKENSISSFLKQNNTEHYNRNDLNFELNETQSLKKSTQDCFINKEKTKTKILSQHDADMEEQSLKNETTLEDDNQREPTKMSAECRKTILFNPDAAIEDVKPHTSQKKQEWNVLNPKRRGTIFFENAGHLDETGLELVGEQRANHTHSKNSTNHIIKQSSGAAMEIANANIQQKELGKGPLEAKKRQTILFQNDGNLDETFIEPFHEQNRTQTHQENFQPFSRNDSNPVLKENYSKVHGESACNLPSVTDFREEHQKSSKQLLIERSIHVKTDGKVPTSSINKSEATSSDFPLKYRDKSSPKRGGNTTTFYNKDIDMDVLNFSCHEKDEQQSIKPTSANTYNANQPQISVFASERKLNETDFNFSGIVAEEYPEFENPPVSDTDKTRSGRHKFGSSNSPADIQMSGLNLIPETTQNEVEMYEMGNEENEVKPEQNYADSKHAKKTLKYPESQPSKLANDTNANTLPLEKRRTIIFNGKEATIRTESADKCIAPYEKQEKIDENKRKTLVFQANNDVDLTQLLPTSVESPFSQSKIFMDANPSNNDIGSILGHQELTSKTPEICSASRGQKGTTILHNDLYLNINFENKENVNPQTNTPSVADEHRFKESHKNWEDSTSNKTRSNKNLILQKDNISIHDNFDSTPPHGAKSLDLEEKSKRTVHDPNELPVGKTFCDKTSQSDKNDSPLDVKQSQSSTTKRDLKDDSKGITISNRRGTIYFKSDDDNNMEITICGEESEIIVNGRKEDISAVPSHRHALDKTNFDQIGFDMDLQNESFPSGGGLSMEEKNLSSSFLLKKSPKKTMFWDTTKKSAKNSVTKKIFGDSPNICFNKTQIKDESLSFTTPNSSVPNMFKKIAQNTISLYNAESQESLRQSNTTYYPDTTEALCNLDPSRIDAWKRRRTQAKKSDSIHKNQPEKNVRKNSFRKSLIELTCDSVIALSDNDVEDIDKSNSNLKEAEAVHYESDLTKELQKKDILNVTKTLTSNEKLALETSTNCASCTISLIELDPKKRNIAAGRCPACDKSVEKDTTFYNLVAKLPKDDPDLCVDFSAYDKFNQCPSFKDLFRSFDKKREMIAPEQSFNESISFPTIPPKAFLLKNYMQSMELEDQVPIPALYPKTPTFEFLIKNRLNSENSVWLFNDVYAPINALEFRHKAVRTITIFVHFGKSKGNEANHVNFTGIEVSKCGLYKKMTPFDSLLQSEVLAKIPNYISEFYSCGCDLFVFLEKLNISFEKALHEMQQFMKIISSGNARLVQNSKNESLVSKTIRRAKFPPSSVNIKIHIKKLKHISWENVTLPPKCSFNEHAYVLPSGMDFLIQFLKHPEKYFTIGT